jgi:hypothetical protein
MAKRPTSSDLDGFAELNPARDFPPAAVGGIFIFFETPAHTGHGHFAPESS